MRRLVELLPALGLTLAWLMPLHFPPWVTWHSEAPVFAAVLLAATWGLALVLFRGGPAARVEVPAMAIGLMAVGVLACIQAATGIVRFYGDAWTVLLYLALCAAAFQLGHANASKPEQIESASSTLAWTLLLAGLGCTVVALVQALDVWDTSEWIARTPSFRRPGGNLGQPNQMATLLLMGTASLVFLFERGRIGLSTAIGLGMVLGLGLATTESRTGLLSVVVLGGWWLCRGYRSRLSRTAIVAAVAFVGVAYLVWPPLLEGFHGQGGSGVARVNTQVGFRAIVWPQLLEAAAQRPWLGWGVRQTSLALTSVVHAHPVSEPYTYAHNLLLELLLAFGAPLSVLLVLGAAVWALRRWPARNDVVGWYCLALWAPLSVHALLEFPYSYAYLLAPAMFALGLINPRSNAGSPRHVPASVLGAILAGTWVVAVWSVLDYVKVEEDFRVARFEAGRIGVTPPEYERPRIYLLTQLGAMVEAARVVPKPGMSPAEVELSGDVAARYPWPALQNRYALALALNGEPAAAEKELRVILAMHGEANFREIRLNWKALESDKYPQLRKLQMPGPTAPVSALR